jgi:hypothetical protein
MGHNGFYDLLIMCDRWVAVDCDHLVHAPPANLSFDWSKTRVIYKVASQAQGRKGGAASPNSLSDRAQVLDSPETFFARSKCRVCLFSVVTIIGTVIMNHHSSRVEADGLRGDTMQSDKAELSLQLSGIPLKSTRNPIAPVVNCQRDGHECYRQH